MSSSVAPTKNKAFDWNKSYQCKLSLLKSGFQWKINVLSGHSNWRHLSGLPIVAVNLCLDIAITVSTIAENLLKGLRNLSVGIVTLNGKTAKKGAKQLGIVILEVSIIPFKIIGNILGLIIVPAFVLLSPDAMHARCIEKLAALNARKAL